MLSSQSATHVYTPPAPGPITRLARRVRQFICGLHGHDALLHFGPDRVSLLCASCAYESPGWEVAASPPRRTQPAEGPRRIVQMPLVHERRVA